MHEQLAIVGTGAIACGLAVVAARDRGVVMYARSAQAAERARASIAGQRERLGTDAGSGAIDIATEWADLASATFLVEAVAEDFAAKAAVFEQLAVIADGDAIVATTTSSLPLGDLAAASGRPDRFVGLHVFNPVPRMELIELSFPPAAAPRTRDRALALCEDLGKTAVVVPDTPGFVVNRLLFPFLFAAVDFLDQHDLPAADVDACMRLGAGHPMGPLALLDFVGLDVSAAIGRAIGVRVPARIEALIAEGALGRKSGRGFYEYG